MDLSHVGRISQGNNSHAITLTGSYSPTYRASDSLFGTPVVDFTSANALLADPVDWSGAYTLFYCSCE